MLHLDTWLIKERVGLLKLVDVYDIFDPATGSQVGVAKETPPLIAQILRVFVGKRWIPTQVTVSASPEPGSQVFFTLDKPFAFFRPKVIVYEAAGQPLGYMVGKLFTIGGGFHVYDMNDQQVAEVQGDFLGWNFSLVDVAGQRIGTITKKWAGIGKELFTSADNYVVQAEGPAKTDQRRKILLLGAALAIDIAYKEHNR